MQTEKKRVRMLTVFEQPIGNIYGSIYEKIYQNRCVSLLCNNTYLMYFGYIIINSIEIASKRVAIV